MRLTWSLLRTWAVKVASAVQYSAARSAPPTNSIFYSVKQRKDVKCFTLLGDYARPGGTLKLSAYWAPIDKEAQPPAAGLARKKAEAVPA
jgi:hypothetical protein